MYRTTRLDKYLYIYIVGLLGAAHSPPAVARPFSDHSFATIYSMSGFVYDSPTIVNWKELEKLCLDFSIRSPHGEICINCAQLSAICERFRACPVAHISSRRPKRKTRRRRRWRRRRRELVEMRISIWKCLSLAYFSGAASPRSLHYPGFLPTLRVVHEGPAYASLRFHLLRGVGAKGRTDWKTRVKWFMREIRLEKKIKKNREK